MSRLPGEVRPSLADPEFDPVWRAVRSRLDRQGAENRGRIRLPSLSARGRFLLGALLGRPATATLDLRALEEALAALGVASSLPAALEVLGHPVPVEAAARRARRAAAREARAAVGTEASSWPEDWAAAWADAVGASGVLAGLDVGGARELARKVRAVLDHLRGVAGETRGCSRTELAAAALGSAHALDRGTRTAAAVTRALSLQYPGSDRKAVWAVAGVQPDLVSATVLCWNLRPASGSGLATILAEASELGVPIHLTQYALRRHPVVVGEGGDVLAVENPRVVEAAAEARVPFSVVAVNGDASAAARLLIAQLLECGTGVRYHGDFDAAGLAICGRMQVLGLVPWHMDTEDYLRALSIAVKAGTPLPAERRDVPPTPWAPDLQETFRQRRKIVHEELLLDELLQSVS